MKTRIGSTWRVVVTPKSITELRSNGQTFERPIANTYEKVRIARYQNCESNGECPTVERVFFFTRDGALTSATATYSDGTSSVSMRACKPGNANQPPRPAVLGARVTGSNRTPTVTGILNGSVKLSFLVDSGATDVVVPEDHFERLGIKPTGRVTAQIADGSSVLMRTFTIQSLTVGNAVAQNVIASISPRGSEALLGMSFLGRYKSWSINNSYLILNE